MFPQPELLSNFCKKYAVIMMLLFGSRAREQHTENSDLDLAVLSTLEELNYDKMTMELMELFPGYSLDVVLLDRCDPMLKFEIISSYKILFCRDDDTFINFYLSAVKMHHDLKKFYTLEKDYLDNFLEGKRNELYECYPPQIN